MRHQHGGPAFPELSVVAGERDGHGDLIEPFTSASGGMSLRDWFAGQVLAALAVNGTEASWDDDAVAAYAAADAMLKAREADNG